LVVVVEKDVFFLERLKDEIFEWEEKKKSFSLLARSSPRGQASTSSFSTYRDDVAAFGQLPFNNKL